MLLKSGIHFDRWANKRVLEQLSNHSIPEAQTLISHIVHAQQVWLSRINGMPFSGDIFELLSLDEIGQRIDRNHALLLKSLDSNSEESIIEYNNLKGEPQQSLFADIVFHAIIHGQHHRAQIATLIRQRGFVPLSTDYIFYTRTEAHQQDIQL